MAKLRKKGAGVSDKLTLTVTHAPVVRMTDITQLALRRLILEHIKGLPEMRGFEILTAAEAKARFDVADAKLTTAIKAMEELHEVKDWIKWYKEYVKANEERFAVFMAWYERKDDGLQFIVSISGKGEKSRGRQPELMIVHFEVTNPKKSRLVVSQEMWDRVEALRVAILLSPQLKSLNLKVYDRTYWSGYDLEDDLPPRKFALTIEFYPPEQDELEKKVAARGRNYAEKRAEDALRKALRMPATREEIKRCVTEE